MADADDHGGGCSGGSDIIVCTAGAAPQTVVPPSAGIMGKSHSLSLSLWFPGSLSHSPANPLSQNLLILHLFNDPLN